MVLVTGGLRARAVCGSTLLVPSSSRLSNSSSKIRNSVLDKKNWSRGPLKIPSWQNLGVLSELVLSCTNVHVRFPRIGHDAVIFYASRGDSRGLVGSDAWWNNIIFTPFECNGDGAVESWQYRLVPPTIFQLFCVRAAWHENLKKWQGTLVSFLKLSNLLLHRKYISSLSFSLISPAS